MAKTGNHQLKVFNLFNKGEENIVDTHLIHDTGFVEVINVDTTESVIKPARSSATINKVRGEHYIEETVKGEQRGITFDKPMNYVQFADTVYAVPREGGNVYQALVDDTNSLSIASLFYNVENIKVEPTYHVKFVNPFTSIYFVDVPTTKPYNTVTSDNYISLVEERNKLFYKWIDPVWDSDKVDYNEVLSEALATRDKLAALYTSLSNEVSKGSYPSLYERAKADLNTLPKMSDYISNARDVTIGLSRQCNLTYIPYYKCCDMSVDNDMILTAISAMLLQPNYFRDILKWAKERTYLSHLIFILFTNDCVAKDTDIQGYLGSYMSASPRISKSHIGTISNAYEEMLSNLPDFLNGVSYTDALTKLKDDLKFRTDLFSWYIGTVLSKAPTQPLSDPSTSHAMWLGVFFALFSGFDRKLGYSQDLMHDTLYTRVLNENPSVGATIVTPVNTVEGLDKYSIDIKQALDYVESTGKYYADTADALRNLNLEQDLNATLHKYLIQVTNTATNVNFNKYIDNWIYADVNAGVNVYLRLSQAGKYTITVARRTLTDTAYRIYYKQDITITDTSDVTLPNIKPTTEIQGEVWYNSVLVAHPTAELSTTDFDLLQVYNGSMFIAHTGSQDMWFSEPNQANFIKATGHLKVSQPIVAMQQAGAGLFIFTEDDALYLLTGYVNDGAGNNTLAIKRIASGVRPLSAKAVTAIDNLLIWLSTDGIHTTSGYGSSYGTRDIWRPSPDWGTVIDSIVFEGNVYFLYSSGMLISYNYSKQRILKFKEGGLNNLTLSSFNGRLFSVAKQSPTENSSNALTLYELFKGNSLVTYYAELKHFAGYSFDTRLRFTNIVVSHTDICYKGSGVAKGKDSTIKIYIDNRLVATGTLQGLDSSRINIPQGNNVGQSIYFILEGTLKVRSIRLRYSIHNYED